MLDLSKVIISADSTCDLPKELAEKYNIKICHGPVILGDKVYTDGIDIQPCDLFKYHDETGVLPKTAAINYQDYIDFFTPLTEDGNTVVHFCLSSEMSSMCNNAKMAAEDVENVYVIDSRNLSTGIALLVLQAAEMAQNGEDAENIYNKMVESTDKVNASFVIDTLLYLHKGGRCSSVAMLGANLLKLKPCIEVHDGKMDVAKKYRGKYSDVLIEYTKNRLENLDNIDSSRCFVTHTMEYGSEQAKLVYDYIKSLNFFDEVIEATAGCTISAHCGPGTLGVLFLNK